ncbi:hypothetical protein ACFWFI_08375 [Streptomyces sp. NPDC060209]|uniref:hypothetical protein n=1 Tax=Streptomyces sp. NPDC060209 TaxID=3347073 RepID=UPI0036495FEF
MGPTACLSNAEVAAPIDTTEESCAEREAAVLPAVTARAAAPAAGTSTVAERASGQVTFGA